MKKLIIELPRTRVYVATVILLCIIFLIYTANLESSSTAAAPTSEGEQSAVLSPSATFPANAGSLGAISDGTSPCWNPGLGAPRDVTFTVAGITGAPSNMSISMTFGSPTHTFIGDITATLIAPDGTTSCSIFGRTGSTTATGFGDSSDLGTSYTFSDTAPTPPSGGWWQEATARGAAEVMTSGTYRTTNSGGAGAVNPQPPTNFTSTFAGIPTANGTWTLRLRDGCAGDTGAITAASLTMSGSVAVPTHTNVDMNGDGRTDWVVARGTNTPLTGSVIQTTPHGPDPEIKERRSIKREDAAPLAPPIFWYVAQNGAPTTYGLQWGDAATDIITPSDFDGDSKTDVAIWRPGVGGSAGFYILQSQTGTFRFEQFGQTGDDPAVVNDYDGDGKADPAVYRCPPISGPAGQCFFYYRGSLNNPGGNVTFVAWGFGVDGDNFPYIGDFDGDGKGDFCVQRTDPGSPSNAQFAILKSAGGSEFIRWGFPSDFLIPGDYDGDAKTDICVRRTSGGLRTYYVLFRTGGSLAIQWGITGDSSVPGDYDGDGKTDFAIWRPSATPGQTAFWVLNSGTGSVTVTPWGRCPDVSTCDFAVAGWAVH